MRIESMKGKWCPYKAIRCEEGYCQDCQIYLDRQKGQEKLPDIDSRTFYIRPDGDQMEVTMPEDSRNDLGKILKQRRVVIPLTVKELAAKSGVSASHLGRIERGERFPSARTLRKIAKPLGFDEGELLILAGFMTPQPPTEVGRSSSERLDPYVASVLASEPVATQRTVIGILSVLKSIAARPRLSEWPEFREYAHRKYPELDEDIITMIKDIVEHPGKQIAE